MAEPFDSIARQAYEEVLGGRVTNAKLREYFNTCFQNSIDHKQDATMGISWDTIRFYLDECVKARK